MGRWLPAALIIALCCTIATASAQQGSEGNGASPQAPGSKKPQSGVRSDESGASSPGRRAKVVRVGVLVNDIQQLDLQSHSYNVDMYMWFKWKDGDIDRRARSSS